jgi:hypothetical protein
VLDGHRGSQSNSLFSLQATQPAPIPTATAVTAPRAAPAPASAPGKADDKSPEEDVAALEAELAACNEVTPEVLDRVVALVRRVTGATGVYVGEKVGGGSGLLPDGEEPPPLTASSTVVKYIAATPESAFLLKERLREGQGVTWKCWIPPDDGSSSELPIIHEEDVLHNPRVHFHVVPKPGALCVAPIQVGGPFRGGLCLRARSRRSGVFCAVR